MGVAKLQYTGLDCELADSCAKRKRTLRHPSARLSAKRTPAKETEERKARSASKPIKRTKCT